MHTVDNFSYVPNLCLKFYIFFAFRILTSVLKTIKYIYFFFIVIFSEEEPQLYETP